MILIIGGMVSGKSTLAQQIAAASDTTPTIIDDHDNAPTYPTLPTGPLIATTYAGTGTGQLATASAVALVAARRHPDMIIHVADRPDGTCHVVGAHGPLPA